LAPIKDSVLAHDYALQIAGMTRVREDVVLDALAKLKPVRVVASEANNAAAAKGQRAAGLGPSGAVGASPRVNSSAVGTAGGSAAARAVGTAGEVSGTVGGAAGPAGASTSAASSARNAVGAQAGEPVGGVLDEQERNRLQVEQEFLSLLAHKPELALQYADRFAQVLWHSNLHAQVAQDMLDALADDPTLDASALVSRAARNNPQAAQVLTTLRDRPTVLPQDLAAYLSEELALGDDEALLEMYKAQLANPSDVYELDSDALFKSVMDMQKSLLERHKRHKLKEQYA
jgi:DNA primase